MPTASKKVPKPTLKKSSKSATTKVSKTIPKPSQKKPVTTKKVSNLVSINNEKKCKDFKIENNAIYIIRSENCFYCRDMRSEWDKATAINKNIKIYEIEAEYLYKIPTLNNIVQSYPTILRYHNGFQPFTLNRSAENFSTFMRTG
jgi:hypothetical protein